MIKIYTIPECPYCSELKEFLKLENIEFTEINVLLEENKEEYKKIFEKTQSDEVPIIKVGKQLLVPNVSFHTIRESVELTKQFLV